jgi:hypothetical protein
MGRTKTTKESYTSFHYFFALVALTPIPPDSLTATFSAALVFVDQRQQV